MLTFLLPAAMVLAGAGLFMANRGDSLVPALVLIGAFPLGLASGYLLIGLPLRGLAVVAGGYGLLALAIATMFSLPTAFEDAGVLIGGAAVVLAIGLTGYAGWAAYDVHKEAGRRLDGPAAGGA